MRIRAKSAYPPGASIPGTPTNEPADGAADKVLGRGGETKTATDLLQLGKAVLLAGAPGVGKSTLGAFILQQLTGSFIKADMVAATSAHGVLMTLWRALLPGEVRVR